MRTEDVHVGADGSTTFESANSEQGGGEESYSGGNESGGIPGGEEAFEEAVVKGIDPSLYVIFGSILVIILYYFYYKRQKAKEEEDDFFSNLDGDKFDIKLPAEVDEYYQIKEKCESDGWKSGSQSQGGLHKVMAQALMKRAIADIPIVSHIQKESGGMNKLYSQSMCSVKQWRSYQNAETLVSTEVEEVRAEADEIEPGWSQAIWRQAMQYHNMLKQRHDMQAKQLAEAERKRKELENKKTKEGKKTMDATAKALAAEKAAEELIKAEEREKESKKAFSGTSMKKGFLDSGKSKKK